AAQVVTLAQMRGTRQPAGLYLAGRILRDIDRHHLPIALMVVDSVEGGAPIVEGIEEIVLQRDVPVLAYDPPVIPCSTVAPRALLDSLITLRSADGQTTRRVATQQQ